MAFITADRVRETTSTTGTSSYALSGAATGFRAFSSVMAVNDTAYYTATNGTDFEVGFGTFTAGTLARTRIITSSNAGSAVSWSAGSKDIFLTAPAEQISVDPLAASFLMMGA